MRIAGAVLLATLALLPTAAAQRVPTSPEVRLFEEAKEQIAEAGRLRGPAPVEADELLAKARANLSEALRRDPAFADAAVVLGRLLLETKQSEEAVRVLALVRRRTPGNVTLDHLYGIHLFRVGRQAEGAEVLESAVRRAPDLFDASYLLAGHYYRAGKLEEALPHAATYLKHRPDDAQVLGMVGNIRLQQGRLEDAVQAFRRVLVVDPGNVTVRVNLGTVFHKLKEYAKAIEVLEKVLARRPDLAVVHHNLGSCYFQLERWADAAERYLSFIQLEPENASAHYYAGVSLVRNGQPNDAVPLLARASSLAPRDPWAPFALAEIALGRGDLATAQAFAAAALERKDGSARILLLCGIVSRRRQDYASAIRHLEKAMQLDAASAPIRAELGYARFLAGQVDAGIDDLEAARTLAPGEPRVLGWLPVARTRRAVVRAYAGDLAGAEADLRRALEIRPSLVDSAWNLAVLEDARGRSKEGLRVIQTALSHSPADPNLHLAAAFLLTRLGQPELAQGELERAAGAADVGIRLLVQGAIHGSFREYDAAITSFAHAADVGAEPGPALALARLDRAASLIAGGHARLAVVELEQLGPQLAPPESRVRAGLLLAGKLALKDYSDDAGKLLDVLAGGPVPQGWGLRRLQGDKDLVRGYLLYRLGAAEKALVPLDAHVRRRPDDARGRTLLAAVLGDIAERDYAARRFGEAERKMARAYELVPADPNVRHNLAAVRFARGDHESAAKAFRELLEAVPEATLNLALYLDDVAGRGSDALALYREYLTMGRPAGEVARRRIERKERLFGP